MSERNTGAAPFTREMNRLKLADELAQTVSKDYPLTPAEQVRFISDKVSALVMPLEIELVAGNLPYYQFTTEVKGIRVHLDRGPDTHEQANEQGET